ncbi:hypothetical protein N7457_009574 [Penicillium paradoxum]|uniref:uncharacterized protein n=1 Tax=Penicillium paradoxum TaxID=176176 RepID=UPI002548296A|nr:uncharacterized protein N7457_009574 [Penicillium paradoxum]KAJ5774678.1 hypothetical protein N7457_009574 [Penicillium paradoxum]
MAFHPALESVPEHEPMVFVSAGHSDRVISEVAVPNMKPRRSLFSSWRCSHPDCIAYPYSKKAIFCRGVQRPLWTIITIMCVSSVDSTPTRQQIALDAFVALFTFSLTMSNYSGIINLLTVAWQCMYYLIMGDGFFVFHRQSPSTVSNWTTQGVTPIGCHSHNDYLRHVPLHSALRVGCTSAEADIWSWKNEILVGHSRYTVFRGTLKSLYLDPLLKMLDAHNAPSHGGSTDGSQKMVGLFSNDPKKTFTLMIDFKTEDDKIWPLLVDQLDPLREKGYLTHFNGYNVTYGPITIVASGDAPFHLMLENTTYRDVFYDAPLGNLTFPAEMAAKYDNLTMDKTYNPYNSYFASADFRKTIGSLPLNRLSDVQLSTIRSQVQAAHQLGLKVRYWGTPTSPVGLRNHIWHVLVHEGVDLINVDDLRGVAKLDWKTRYW